MYFEIAAIAAVIIFAILSFYVIKTLIAFQKTLKHIDLVTFDLNLKMKNLDSTLHTISNLGDICEDKTALVRNELHNKKIVESGSSDYSEEVADLLLAGIKIGSKFITRRK